MKSFLQTESWLKFQQSVGRKTWRFDNGKIKANIIRMPMPFGFNYLYIPHGPEIDFNAMSGSIRNEVAQFVKYLKELAKQEKSVFVKIEPLDDKIPEVLYPFKFKHSSKRVQPNRTVVMDLTKSEEELLSAMHHKTRYNIKVADKHGLKFTAKKDIDVFWDMLKQTSKHDNFSTHPKEYYEKLCSTSGLMAETVFMEHEGKPIAGMVWLADGDRVYYLHGAMDRNPKYKPMMAPYGLHWAAMMQAKGYGMKTYDFWGIDAARWPGVTRFKLGWGGQQIEYPGAFDLSVRRFWFFLYKVLKKLF